MQAIIMAGGSGTRLRPVSTSQNPKQFMTFKNWKSLLQTTYERMFDITQNHNHIRISSNALYQDQILSHLSIYQNSQIILEPSKQNTAPAFACVIKYLLDHTSCDMDEIILFCPADQLIHPSSRFVSYVHDAYTIAQQGKIVLFGVQPNRPETGYGYIHCADMLSDQSVYQISKFVEKPDRQTAQTYIDQGNYFRNAGTFMMSIRTLMRQFSLYCPDIASLMELDYDAFISQYHTLLNISIDYAVMEKTQDAMLIPMIITWSDIWSRDSIYIEWEKDLHDNVVIWNHITNTGSHNMIYSTQDRKIVIDDCHDIIVVDSADGVYIARRGNSQNIKQFIS